MKSVLKNLVAVVVSLGIVGVAHVACGGIIIAPTLTISDGVDPEIAILDNGLGDLNGTIGALTLSTNMGVWNLSISTGVTAPALGSFTNPVMDLVIQASSTGAGSLTYTFSEIGFSHSNGNVNAAMSGHVISGAPTTVNYSVYGDASDALDGLTTQLTSTGTIPLPVLISNSGTLPSSSLYSLSQVVQLTASGASAVSVDASLNVTPIPEPSSAGLTFLGLAFLVVGLARRRHSLHCVGYQTRVKVPL
jgi:hypothetical protein